MQTETIAPLIIINGVMLNTAQAMAVMSAVTRYTSILSYDGLGDDETGKGIAAAYIARLNEVQKIIYK
jgi:hypothetical protein